jgi:hypothetical protein
LTYSGGYFPGYLSNDSAGIYTVTITASDPSANGTAAPVSCTFNWTVNPQA